MAITNSKNSVKLYKVFTAGKYPQGEISEADIKSIAESYNPDFHPAPLTLNHNSSDPALGWVDRVIAKGKDLFVSFHKISDQAKEITGSMLYRRPSVEIANYDGVGKYLRAVSLVLFPQVKNLPDLQFTADGEAVIYFSETVSSINLFSNTYQKTMELKQFTEQLGMRQDSTTEDILIAFSEKVKDLGQTVQTQDRTIQDLRNVISQSADQRAESLTEMAFSQGKITEAQKPAIKSLALSDPDNCQKFLDSLQEMDLVKQGSKVSKGDSRGKEAQAVPGSVTHPQTGKVITYSDILKDMSLADGLDEAVIESLKSGN